MTNTARSRLRIAILLLLAEKILQHLLVSLAFYFNWNDINSTVAVDPTVLLILGSAATLLFCLALWGFATAQSWATLLVAGLALFDIVGEFIAQGTILITITVSFVVAWLLLVLVLMYRKRMVGSVHAA